MNMQIGICKHGYIPDYAVQAYKRNASMIPQGLPTFPQALEKLITFPGNWCILLPEFDIPGPAKIKLRLF